ncbi:MAG: methyltransferase domain-containing protein [Burkholderiaceae bacterium]|nr:methyltransferase domain-containing protein [Burkholderiaceae bacterium]
MPGYETKQEQIAVAGVADLTIRSLLDRQQFADPLGAADRLGISSAAWPLFGLLWPSGAQLAARLAAWPVTAGERILEIGCGLGLASLVGHRRGADITASDCHPLAGSFMRENLRLNGLAPMKYRHGHWSATPVQSRHALDDGQHALDGRFDLIVGSDLLYERDESGELARFIAAHAAPGARVWIVDPDRGNRAAFNRHMAALGFTMHEQRLDRPSSRSAAAYKGRLLSYRHTPPLQ